MTVVGQGGPPRFFALQSGDGFVLAGTCGRGISRSTDEGASWQPQEGQPGSGWVNQVVCDGPKVVAATQESGVHVSDDGGLTWSPTGLTRVTCYAVLITGDRLFAGTHGAGLLHSDDGGTTWTPVGGAGSTTRRSTAWPCDRTGPSPSALRVAASGSSTTSCGLPQPACRIAPSMRSRRSPKARSWREPKKSACIGAMPPPATGCG